MEEEEEEEEEAADGENGVSFPPQESERRQE